MPNTSADLSNAVKRFLTSNTNLITPIPGQPVNGDVLMAVIDDGIMSAANSARVQAEEAHDFAANDGKGRAVLTFGAPVNLDRVPTKRFFSGMAAYTVDPGDVVGLESSLTDWPELTLKAKNGLPVDVSRVVTVSFGGVVSSPLIAGQEYTVIEARTNSDYTTTLVLGITPGVALSVTGSSVIFNVGEIKRFKTLRSAWLPSGLSAKPIKVQHEQAKMIRLMKDQGMNQAGWYPNPDDAMCYPDYELTIAGRFAHLNPVSTQQDLIISGQVWMEPYTSQTDTDFLLQNGFEYMMWAVIVEMNHLLLKYVPRQEGTLSPPTNARDAAFNALVLWDSHSTAGNIYYDL
jgi:hypothetical protein